MRSELEFRDTILCNAELQFRLQITLLDGCGTGVPRYDFLKNNGSICNAELQFRIQMALLDECGTGVPRYDFIKIIQFMLNKYHKSLNINIL